MGLSGNRNTRNQRYSFETYSVFRMNGILFCSFSFRLQNKRNSIPFILKTEYYSQKNASLDIKLRLSVKAVNKQQPFIRIRKTSSIFAERMQVGLVIVMDVTDGQADRHTQLVEVRHSNKSIIDKPLYLSCNIFSTLLRVKTYQPDK